MSTSEPGLVPELLVTAVDPSIKFWCSICGFTVRYARPEERFPRIGLGSAQLMLAEVGIGRDWITGLWSRPLGRGVNCQITVPDADVVATTLTRAGVELFMPPETKQYQVGAGVALVRQFLVTDRDGYLVRFQSSEAG